MAATCFFFSLSFFFFIMAMRPEAICCMIAELMCKKNTKALCYFILRDVKNNLSPFTAAVEKLRSVF